MNMNSDTASAPQAPPPSIIPWVELYRPKDLSEVSHQSSTIATLQNAIETNRLPHLLFYGPPGTGKTSVANALCRQLYPPELLKRKVLELNASDERGISVVRNKIKVFAGLAVGSSGSVAGSGANADKKYPNPPFKIIILDEADTVTPDAQAALRRVIEAYSRITRFILICNYVTRIIEPLASRCAKFRFQPLPPSSMRDRLNLIASDQKCRFPNNDPEPVLTEILHWSGGDMRRAVTTLQSAHCASSGDIRVESIAEMAGVPPRPVLKTLISALSEKSFDVMQEAVLNVVAEGYAAQTILTGLSEILIMEDDVLGEVGRAELSMKIAEADKKLMDGADEVLQLLSVCSTAMQCMSMK